MALCNLHGAFVIYHFYKFYTAAALVSRDVYIHLHKLGHLLLFAAHLLIQNVSADLFAYILHDKHGNIAEVVDHFRRHILSNFPSFHYL